MYSEDYLRQFIWAIFRGINVLNNKTELEKAFAKHKKSLDEKRKEKEIATETIDNEFKKMLSERAKRLEKVIWICLFFATSRYFVVVWTSIQYKMSHINYFQFDDKPEAELPAHQPEMRQSKSRPGPQPQQCPPQKTPAAMSPTPTKLPPPRRAAPVAAAAADQESEFARVFNQLRRDKQRPEQLVA